MQRTLCEAFGVSELQPFQLAHALDLSEGRDVFLAVGTGQGKTVVLLSPLVAASKRGESGIGILIVPTKALAQQQEDTSRKRGLQAFSITEDTVRESDLFGHVAQLKGVRLAIMSPQMARGDRFDRWLRVKETHQSIRWILIDEAHLAGDDSGPFKAYGELGFLRPRLPRTTVWCAVTGTITPSSTLTVAKRLGFQPGSFVNARYPLDRSNTTHIPLFFDHSFSGDEFLDLSFVVPFGMTSHSQILPTLIFATTIATSHAIMSYLDSLIPTTVPNRSQIVKLYNALMPLEYRNKFIEDMNSDSVLRIGVATDTLTYGLDIPTLPRVIVFDLCTSFEQMKQKTGRAGRNGAPAVAITYAPAWVRNIPAAEITTQRAKDDLKRREALPAVLRSWFNPIPSAYNNEPWDVSMCHCQTSLGTEDTDRIQQWKDDAQKKKAPQSRLPRSDGTYEGLDSQMKSSLKRMLTSWRQKKWASVRHKFPNRSHLPAQIFLYDHEITRLIDHAHICTDLPRFNRVMDGWKFLSDYGAQLFKFLIEILKAFTDIYNECSQPAPTAPPVESSKSGSTAAASSSTSAPRSLRVVLRPIPIPPATPSTSSLGKRAPTPTQGRTSTKRRRTAKGKEN
ncbi:P-loop containing nucleoside triphosphate hydrolase protein [Ephemerocybe angulata]|uniref:DNA 3'-5' helicase n=1 Tax=Ephemerocybe angulata TaxID=980116 RepID=A0A8H6LTP9_9AGAR|nr:P-loop containing nucleoside triphosphate hydrolase protein [Tulosesus angulatus]